MPQEMDYFTLLQKYDAKHGTNYMKIYDDEGMRSDFPKMATLLMEFPGDYVDNYGNKLSFMSITDNQGRVIGSTDYEKYPWLQGYNVQGSGGGGGGGIGGGSRGPNFSAAPPWETGPKPPVFGAGTGLPPTLPGLSMYQQLLDQIRTTTGWTAGAIKNVGMIVENNYKAGQFTEDEYNTLKSLIAIKFTEIEAPPPTPPVVTPPPDTGTPPPIGPPDWGAPKPPGDVLGEADPYAAFLKRFNLGAVGASPYERWLQSQYNPMEATYQAVGAVSAIPGQQQNKMPWSDFLGQQTDPFQTRSLALEKFKQLLELPEEQQAGVQQSMDVPDFKNFLLNMLMSRFPTSIARNISQRLPGMESQYASETNAQGKGFLNYLRQKYNIY